MQSAEQYSSPIKKREMSGSSNWILSPSLSWLATLHYPIRGNGVRYRCEGVRPENFLLDIGKCKGVDTTLTAMVAADARS